MCRKSNIEIPTEDNQYRHRYCHMIFFHFSSCFSSATLTFTCLSDRWQSYGFCELQCLGRSCVHPSGFCLQDARWNDFCRGCCILPELCGCLYDAIWGCQSKRGDVCAGALSWRWCGKYIFYLTRTALEQAFLFCSSRNWWLAGSMPCLNSDLYVKVKKKQNKTNWTLHYFFVFSHLNVSFEMNEGMPHI